MSVRLPRLPGTEALQEAERAVEATRRKFAERNINLVEMIAETVDDAVEALIGDRPVEDLLKLAAHMSPAVVWKRVTGAPAPGEVFRGLRAKIREEIERLERRVFPGTEKAKRLEKEILA